VRRVAGLYEARPQSLFFAWAYGYALVEERRAEVARPVLRDAVARAETADYVFVDYLEYFLAETLFFQNDFAAAEPYYRRYLARHAGEAMRAQATLRLGLALEMQGRRAEAVTYFERVRAPRDYDTDRVAGRLAERYAARPLSPHERQILRGRNAFDGGRYAEADRLLRPLLHAEGVTEAERAEAQYRLARSLHAQGRLAEAARLYQAAAVRPGDRQGKWRGWGWHYLGEIRRAQGNPQAALMACDRALAAEPPYDYFQALEQAARLAREETRAEVEAR
jgi:tetratricopeptide (TPR) repeat protein